MVTQICPIPWRTVLLEKLISAELLETLPAFYGTIISEKSTA
jgi:hypothetical protein